MTMKSLAELREDRAKGGRATYRKYGRVFYLANARKAAKTRKHGDRTNPTLDQILETPEGQRAARAIARAVGTVPELAFPALQTSRGGRQPSPAPAPDSPASGRRASVRGGDAFAGDQTLGSSCPTSITPQPGSCPRQVTGAGLTSKRPGDQPGHE